MLIPTQNNFNTVNNQDNVITTTAQEGLYKSKKGITISIPKAWDKKVEIKEDSSSITLIYTGIPNRRFEIFSIGCISHEKANEIKSDDPTSNIGKIGENQNYVFFLNHPLAIDLTEQEQQKYAQEISDFIWPVKKYEELIRIVN